MLIIRKEQIQHFIAEDESQLVKLIAGIIRTGNSERVADYSDEMLEAMTRIGIERAKSHNFELAQDIAAFVAIMFEISPNFDTQKEIKNMLADQNFSGDERFTQLWGRTTEEAWKEAENSYEARVWFPDKEQ